MQTTENGLKCALATTLQSLAFFVLALLAVILLESTLRMVNIMMTFMTKATPEVQEKCRKLWTSLKRTLSPRGHALIRDLFSAWLAHSGIPVMDTTLSFEPDLSLIHIS